MQQTKATHSDLAGSVMHDREAGLVWHLEDRDLVSVWLASSGFCVPSSLFLRFGLNGMFHRGASLLSQVVAVVVVREILALGLGRSPSSGRHHFFVASDAPTSLCLASTAEASAGDQWTFG